MKLSTQPPVDSVIQVHDDQNVLRLSWKDCTTYPVRQIGLYITGFFSVVMPFQGLVAIVMFGQANADQPNMEQHFQEAMRFLPLIMLPFWLLFLCGFYSLWSRKLEQRVCVTDQNFEFDPGPKLVPLWARVMIGPMFMGPFIGAMTGNDSVAGKDHPGKTLQIPWDQLGKFTLERIGERQRLTFDHGAQRIEIGRSLTEPEREWLTDQLSEWSAQQS